MAEQFSTTIMGNYVAKQVAGALVDQAIDFRFESLLFGEYKLTVSLAHKQTLKALADKYSAGNYE